MLACWGLKTLGPIPKSRPQATGLSEASGAVHWARQSLVHSCHERVSSVKPGAYCWPHDSSQGGEHRTPSEERGTESRSPRLPGQDSPGWLSPRSHFCPPPTCVLLPAPRDTSLGNTIMCVCAQPLQWHPAPRPHETEALQAPLSMGSSRQTSGRGCHALLQGLFPTQGSNLQCRQILYRRATGEEALAL